MSSRLFAAVISALIIGAVSFGTAGAVELPNRSPVAEQKKAALMASFGQPALAYLESLKGKAGFKAPSELDPRFTIALYVNAAGSGDNAQRMWVLHRDAVGGDWRMAMWDEKLWKRRGLPEGVTPPYSWLVSTGRHYRGDNRSGPTPTGVFAIDERKHRIARGHVAPGMINVINIDLHYSSGRMSGVAFHGTTTGKYSRLGRIDSHGCIRMTQPNALDLINRLSGRDGVLDGAMRWGDVPRFWQRGNGNARYGYTRDGSMHPVKTEPMAADHTGEALAAAAEPTMTDASPFPDVLTKTGYRAVSVIFQD